jgi:MoxR-like ATPase
VQSALLEAMEERQISMDGKTYPLPKPFLVMATQNPVETYGTYHLPEAQMDRFFMKLTMGYPLEDEEIRILERTENGNPISNITEPAVSVEDIQALQQQVRSISVSDNIKKYIINLVSSTRQSPYVTLGISPRGSIALYRGAKACAFVFERSFVVPEDIKNIAVSVLAHRIILSQQGKNTFGTAEKYIQNLIDNTEIPV